MYNWENTRFIRRLHVVSDVPALTLNLPINISIDISIEKSSHYRPSVVSNEKVGIAHHQHEPFRFLENFNALFQLPFFRRAQKLE